VAYRVELRPEAAEDLHHLYKAIAQRVLKRLRWLSENFEGLTPEPLTAEWKGLFKFRLGSYRIIYTVNQDEQVITVHLIGHCKDIYKKR